MGTHTDIFAVKKKKKEEGNCFKLEIK